jgi:hypothetical protein
VLRADAPDSAAQYSIPWDPSINTTSVEWAADSRGLFEAGRHRTLGFGIWLHRLGPSPARLVLRADDPTLSLDAIGASATRLYFSINRRESDLWTAEVVTR